MPEHTPRATQYISQQLELVRKLKEKGYTYQIDDGIYFDTSKFPTYADFAGLDLAAQKAGARVEFNPKKRNPSDFALWKFSPKGEKRDMEWETPTDLFHGEQSRVAFAQQEHLQPERKEAPGPSFEPGAKPFAESTEPNGEQNSLIMGFPGWHLECSAMAMNILGNTIDIHTGGIDHIPVHHTNEIAQSEAASGKLFARFWLHNDHLKSNGTKISKSLGNGYTLQDIEAKGFSAIDFRMFALQSQYHNESNFTWENLAAAKNRLTNWRNIAALRHQTHDTLRNDDDQSTDEHTVYLYAASQAMLEALNDNLNTPAALAIIDDAFSKLSNTSIADVHQHGLEQLLETIDHTLGLQLKASTPDISDEAKGLILERVRARENKDWTRSDELRQQLLEQNIELRDTAHGSVWNYK
jgi:cysteinyl-tRNA synthetase